MWRKSRHTNAPAAVKLCSQTSGALLKRSSPTSSVRGGIPQAPLQVTLSGLRVQLPGLPKYLFAASRKQDHAACRDPAGPAELVGCGRGGKDSRLRLHDSGKTRAIMNEG